MNYFMAFFIGNTNTTPLINQHQTNPNIDVKDNDLSHIFKSGYTSESMFGLYLTKLFCEINMAHLNYEAALAGKFFNVSFFLSINIRYGHLTCVA